LLVSSKAEKKIKGRQGFFFSIFKRYCKSGFCYLSCEGQKIYLRLLLCKKFCITLISFDKCEHFCKWTARMVPLGTPAVAILYILYLTSRTRFRSWSFYRYRKSTTNCLRLQKSPYHWVRRYTAVKIWPGRVRGNQQSFFFGLNTLITRDNQTI
jgi:hypothetical protein